MSKFTSILHIVGPGGRMMVHRVTQECVGEQIVRKAGPRGLAGISLQWAWAGTTGTYFPFSASGGLQILNRTMIKYL